MSPISYFVFHFVDKGERVKFRGTMNNVDYEGGVEGSRGGERQTDLAKEKSE